MRNNRTLRIESTALFKNSILSSRLASRALVVGVRGNGLEITSGFAGGCLWVGVDPSLVVMVDNLEYYSAVLDWQWCERERLDETDGKKWLPGCEAQNSPKSHACLRVPGLRGLLFGRQLFLPQ